MSRCNFNVSYGQFMPGQITQASSKRAVPLAALSHVTSTDVNKTAKFGRSAPVDGRAPWSSS